MYSNKLPGTLRGPFHNRELQLGIDIPAKFFNDLKAMDPNLYLVYHPIRVLPTGPVINNYTGSSEDYRVPIHESHGFVCWGYPLTTNKGAPIPDNRWHVYRLCPQGWAHVITLDSKDHLYLKKVIESIYVQVQMEKVGRKAYSAYIQAQDQAAEEKKFNKALNEFKDVQDENKWLMRKALENYQQGITRPTNPTKDIITSYRGQKNRSRIVRPLTDTEGGLILPDRLKN